MRSTIETLQILYEDNHFIVVNKYSGDIVQGDKTGDLPLCEIIKSYLRIKHDKKGDAFLGIVHRLDRPVSGAVLFAKTSKGLSRANAIFADRKARKTYWALVEASPDKKADTLVHYLKKNGTQNKSYAYDKAVPQSKKAILHYEHIYSLERYQLLEVELETGRHHQIRCQLAHIGCIVKGDLKYGARRSNSDASICLHAMSLGFLHPIKNEAIHVLAPLPNNPLWDACPKPSKEK